MRALGDTTQSLHELCGGFVLRATAPGDGREVHVHFTPQSQEGQQFALVVQGARASSPAQPAYQLGLVTALLTAAQAHMTASMAAQPMAQIMASAPADAKAQDGGRAVALLGPKGERVTLGTLQAAASSGAAPQGAQPDDPGAAAALAEALRQAGLTLYTGHISLWRLISPLAATTPEAGQLTCLALAADMPSFYALASSAGVMGVEVPGVPGKVFLQLAAQAGVGAQTRVRAAGSSVHEGLARAQVLTLAVATRQPWHSVQQLQPRQLASQFVAQLTAGVRAPVQLLVPVPTPTKASQPAATDSLADATAAAAASLSDAFALAAEEEAAQAGEEAAAEAALLCFELRSQRSRRRSGSMQPCTRCRPCSRRPWRHPPIWHSTQTTLRQARACWRRRGGCMSASTPPRVSCRQRLATLRSRQR
jgi:hypothetical protein